MAELLDKLSRNTAADKIVYADLKGTKNMAELLDKLPRLTKDDRWMYENLIANHGWHPLAIAEVNRLFLEYKNVKDTRANRNELGRRMRKSNPNRPECPEETKERIKKEYNNRACILKSGQEARNNSNRQHLDEVLGNVNLHALAQSLHAKDYIEFMRLHIEINDQEAKLFGLYNEQKPSRDTDKGSDTSNTAQDEQSDFSREAEAIARRQRGDDTS